MKKTFYLLFLLHLFSCKQENEMGGAITGKLLLYGTQEPIAAADIQLLGSTAEDATGGSAYLSYWQGQTQSDGSFIAPRSSSADWLYFKSTDDYWDLGFAGSSEVDQNGSNSLYYLYGKSKLHILIQDTSHLGNVTGVYVYPYAPESEFVRLLGPNDVYTVDVFANEQQRVAFQKLLINGEQTDPQFIYFTNPSFLGEDTLKIQI